MAISKNNKSRSKKGKSPDPYMRAFLRQAVAIIATERGLNDVSYAKLQSVANQLGLSDKVFQTAIGKLNRRKSSLGLTRYEKQFVLFLSKEFKKISGDVLTIKSENKLSDIAETKYQIDAVRAHQLIQKTADKYNVGTISRQDAELFATQLIDGAVGSRIWLRDDGLQRLYKACRKWGLAEGDVDQAVHARFKRNRVRRRRSFFIVSTSVMGLLACCGAAVLAVRSVDWENVFDLNRTPETITRTTREPGSSSLSWWDDSLAAVTEHLSQDPRMNSRIEQLKDADNNKRGAIYRELTRLAMNNSRVNAQLNEFLIQSYLRDPDQASASTIIAESQIPLLAITGKQVATPSQIRQSLAGNRLLGSALIAANLPNQDLMNRRARLSKLTKSLYNFESAPESIEQYISKTLPVLTVNQWNHALKNSRANPKQVAAILPELEKRDEFQREPGINEIRTNVLTSILNVQSDQWKVLRKSISIAVQHADQQKKALWIKVLLDSTDEPFSDFLLSHLGNSFDLKPEARKDEKLRKLKQYYTKFKYRGLRQTVEANTKIENLVRQIELQLKRYSDSDTIEDPGSLPSALVPQLVANVAHSNNLALSWIRASETTVNYSRFYDIASRTVPAISNPSDAELDKKREPTPSENRRLRENLDRILDSQPGQITARISAVQTLSNLAPRFADLRYPNAKKFAAYILRDKEQRETLEVERALPKFSHWLQLKLAIADLAELDQSIRLDTVLGQLSRLGESNIDVSSQSNWRIAIRLGVMKRVQAELRKRSKQLELEASWSRLYSELLRMYTERSVLHNSIQPRSETASAAALATLRSAVQNHAKSSSMVRSAEWIENLKDNEIEKVVLANQLITEVWASGVNESSESALKHEQNFVTMIKDASLDNGRRLLASELRLMYVLAEYRNRWLERAVE